MIKTCFGKKLMIKNMIYALFVNGPLCRDLRALGGTNQTKN